MNHFPGVRVVSIAILCLIIFSATTAQETGYRTVTRYEGIASEPREHVVDIIHMRVEVTFDAPKGIVKGKVTHIFTPLRRQVDSIFFDGPGVKIFRTLLNNKPVKFTMSDDGVTVHLSPPLRWGSTDSITFVYEARPRKGIYFIGWNDPDNISRKQIWTQGQAADNRYWIPMYDEMNDKMITETMITFDKQYQVLSNGTKISERANHDGTKTWHYTMTNPHSSYLLMIGVGKYAVQTRFTQRGVPVHLWYYPEHPERVEPTYRYSTECIDFMEEETGVHYPWESYSQIPVQDYIHGAMENTTATLFGDFSLVDSRMFIDRNYVSTNMHELAHQWFGDYVTARSEKGTWLQEGFATFYAKLFRKKLFGEDEYQWLRRGEQNSALAASERDRLPIVHPKAARSRVYAKASALLDMMMYTFGEQEFKRVINYYLRHHGYQNVETHDLYLAFQDTLGLTPDWFFDQWLYRGGEPHYEVSYQDITRGKKRETQVSVVQTHLVDELTGLFRMPVVFEVHYVDGSLERKREWIEKQSHAVVIPNTKGKDIAFVLFDPGSYVLKEVTFKKSFEELRAQALHVPNMIDHYDAILALRGVEADLRVKQQLLAQLFDKEKYPQIRVELVSQLAKDSSVLGLGVMRKALKDPAVEVRAGALNNIKVITSSVLTDYEMLLQDSSFNIVTATLAKLCEAFPENAPRYLEQTRTAYGPSCKVKIKWHEINVGLAQNSSWQGNRSSIDSLVKYASNSYEFGTRKNAFEALRRLDVCEDALIPHLFKGVLNPNGSLSASAASALETFYQTSANKQKIKKYYESRTWEGWQGEILEKIIK